MKYLYIYIYEGNSHELSNNVGDAAGLIVKVFTSWAPGCKFEPSTWHGRLFTNLWIWRSFHSGDREDIRALLGLEFYLTPVLQVHYLVLLTSHPAFTMLKFTEFFPCLQNSTRFNPASVLRRALVFSCQSLYVFSPSKLLVTSNWWIPFALITCIVCHENKWRYFYFSVPDTPPPGYVSEDGDNNDSQGMGKCSEELKKIVECWWESPDYTGTKIPLVKHCESSLVLSWMWYRIKKNSLPTPSIFNISSPVSL